MIAGEMDDEDRIVHPREKRDAAVFKVCDGFLVKRASSFPWAYRRRWFTLSVPTKHSRDGAPMLFYNTNILTNNNNQADDSKKGPDRGGDSPPPDGGGGASSSSRGGSAGTGGDGARGVRLLCSDCRVQLNPTDIEQISVALADKHAALLEPRQLQYLEFAIVRVQPAAASGGDRRKTVELLRARAESSSLLSRWVHCLCHAILH